MPRFRLILRGESAVASMGIVLAAIMLTSMSLLAWWTLRTQNQSLDEARQREVQAIATILSQSAETMLETNELSAMRRLVADSARDHHLDVCRIVLPDGQIVADANPGKITAHKLPAKWGVVPATLADPTFKNLSATIPLAVGGRGPAKLEIIAARADSLWLYWQTQAGVGVIGAGALLAILAVYRILRGKLIAMGAIGEALRAAAKGETNPDVLTVSPDFGPEAQAWNDLLAQKDQFKKQAVADQVHELLGARRETKSDLEAAFDCLSQGLILVDEKMRAKYANGAAAIFLNTKREELVGSDISGLLFDNQVQDELEAVAVKGSKRRSTIEVKRPEASGSGVLKFSIRPVRREDPGAAMLIIEDITQQRVAEESRNTFIAHATHELRSPLTNIRLYVESAIDAGEADPQSRTKALNIINQESRRLERIVGEMLSISEIEAGAFKLYSSDIYLDQLFEEVKPDYMLQAEEKNISLSFNLPPKLPVIKGDRDKIMVAIHNLIGNAIKYTPNNGKVTINVEIKDKQLVVDVIDTGIGIKDEDLEKIFDKFYRAKDPRVGKITGTGLGLTLAQEVIRLHGGSISVQSQLDKGSTFTVTLPTYAEAA